MGGPELAEVQRAFGYAGAGALALKALDLLIKWRTGQRNDALTELAEARQLSRDIREELRKELEATRIDLAASEVKRERLETELILVKRQLSVTDSALRNAVNELHRLQNSEDFMTATGKIKKAELDLIAAGKLKKPPKEPG